MTTRRRRALWGSAVLVGVTAAGAVGWVGWTVVRARAELTAARQDLPAVQAAVLTGGGGAATQLEQVRRHADAAAELTHDPVWSVLAALPWAGRPLATVQGLTGAVRGIADTGLPALVEAADTVHPARLLAGGGRLDVAGLAAAQPALSRAAQSLTQQQDAVTQLDPSWIDAVSQARQQLLTELSTLGATSRDAAEAARLVPPMLGLDGPRRYFIAFQNPAEARGTGGLLDAFAIVLADHGKVSIERTGANTQLPPFSGDLTGLDPAFVARYGATGGTSSWLNANMSPNFPDVATTWEAMWRKGTGQQLDGAVALDPSTLAATLTATGPVSAPAIGEVDASRIDPLVLHQQYQLAQPNGQRKSLMLGVGSAVIEALLNGRASTRVLLPALSAAAGQGHLFVQSRVPVEQAQLVRSGVGGAVDGSSRPFAEAVMVNAGGNKLDSWLRSALDYKIVRCSSAVRSVQVSVTLRNDAPRTGLPAYVTVRSDQPPFPTVPGQNRTELQLLVTRGARLTSATLDGRPLPPAPAAGQLPATLPDDSATAFLQPGAAGGRPGYWLDLETVPGVARTLVLQLTEPTSTQAPLLPVQPMVLATSVSSELGACSGSAAAGPAS
jgi:Protein of unknown function (DUF4012)